MVLATSMTYAEDKKVELKEQKDRSSYALGVNIGNGLKLQQLDVNPDILAAAIKDALAGGKLLMTEQEMKEALSALQKDMLNKMREKMAQQGEKNKKEKSVPQISLKR